MGFVSRWTRDHAAWDVATGRPRSLQPLGPLGQPPGPPGTAGTTLRCAIPMGCGGSLAAMTTGNTFSLGAPSTIISTGRIVRLSMILSSPETVELKTAKLFLDMVTFCILRSLLTAILLSRLEPIDEPPLPTWSTGLKGCEIY